jgi:flavin-binding protein dodecin
MSVARVTEITSSSPKSFEEAMRVGITRDEDTTERHRGLIKNQEVVIEEGKIRNTVRLPVTFILKA